MRPEPKTCNPVELTASELSSTMLEVSSVATLFDIAIVQTPPKLRIIAMISNVVIDSLRKHQPRRVAQKGAVLKMVFWTTRGTRATPKVIVVKHIVPIKHRTPRYSLYSGLM